MRKVKALQRDYDSIGIKCMICSSLSGIFLSVSFLLVLEEFYPLSLVFALYGLFCMAGVVIFYCDSQDKVKEICELIRKEFK